MLQYGINAYASDFLINKENIWFVPFGYNYLCCYNLKRKTMEKAIRLPVENNRPVLYGGIVKSGSKMILIPLDADSAIMYNMADGKVTEFLSGVIREDNYRAYCVENDNVWMIPWIRRNNDIQDVFIQKVNLYNGETKFLEAFPKNTTPKDRGGMWLFNGNCVCVENNLYLGYRNCIIKIDLSNGSRKAYIVGGEKAIFTTMCMIDDDQLCMMDLYGNAIVWNRTTGKPVMEIKNKSIRLERLGIPNGHREGYGSSVVYRNEYVWFIPSYMDKVLQLDLKNNTLSEAWFSSAICGNVMERPDFCGQFSNAHIEGDYLYVWNLWNESFFMIDIRSRKVERRYIEAGFNPDEFCSMLGKYMEEKEGICPEGVLGADGLNLFVHSICSEESDERKRREQTAGIYGTKIWNVINERMEMC